MSRERRGIPGWSLWVLGVAFAGALALAVWHAQRLPEGVVPVAWDKTACAHCRMAVSERGFAAQLQLVDGEVLDFDDPGCLLRRLAELPGERVHAVWLHHLHEERWLSPERAVLVPVMPTPMGYGQGAVEAGTAQGETFEQALAQVRAGGAHR